MGSSALTVLIRVDLPEPEGPQTTTTSPLFTWVLQFFSAWNGPNHLFTSRISIMAMEVFLSSTLGVRCRGVQIRGLADHGQAGLQLLHAIGEREADGEIHHRHEEVHLDQ